MAPVFHDSALALTSAEDERSHLLRLPSETLQNIFQRVEPRDLVSLSQVCRSFHELAAAELYRSIEHVFAEDDTRAGQLSVDRLAAILETLITSDYNYGRFIKKICMETATGVVSNDRSHRSLRHEASYTSAKLLSSLLLAALNRVDSLETFRWNVHLDINKSVFAALSKIPTLQNVHLRLPTEPLSTLSAFSASLAMAPHPHIPLSSSTQNNHPAHHHHHHHHHHHQHQNQHQHMIAPNLNYTSSSSMHPYFFPMSKMEAKGLKKVASLVPNSLQASALTQLTGLKSLAILDIHSLDSLADIARCISLSFSSLKSLKLSFSDPLALKARRRPTPISSASGSASETDDFGLNGDIMPPAPPVAFMNPPAPFNQNNNTPNANDAQVIKERATQDKALAQLLGLEKSMPQGHVERLFEEALASADKEAHEIAVQSDQHDEDRAFVKKLRQIAQDLPPLLSSGGSSTKSKKALEQIEKAAAKYLKYSPDDKSLVEKTASSFTNVNIDVANLSQTVATASADSKTSGKADDADGIDLEHPDEDGDPGDDQIFVENDTHAAVGAGNGMTRTLHLSEHKSNGESVQMDEAKIDKGKGVVREASETFATKGIGANCNAKAETAEIEEYMRKTRGISLDSLSIHLIPVRGSILCRTVDIYALKHLSLLNVGTQRSLWTMLLKLHQSSPLQLTSIHTDNVSPAFLSLVESLHKVTELFMFEPSSRAKVGSLAARTTVKIEEIRNKVLKKHHAYLQKLVVRNDEDASWVFDLESVMLITVRKSQLVELAIGLDSPHLHVLLQRISRLRSLNALQIFYYHPENCNTVLRELRLNIIDNILQCPKLRLQYMAICQSSNGPVNNTVTRLTRTQLRVPRSRKAQRMQLAINSASASRSSSGSTGRSTSNTRLDARASLQQTFSPDPPLSSALAHEDTEDDSDHVEKIFVHVTSNLRLHDITGVKMWDQEAWSVKL